jgi:mono/diheme cytochrome c family protein
MQQRTRYNIIAIAVFTLLLLQGVVPGEAKLGFKQSEAIKHGKALAKLNCARCHSIELEGASPHEKAPPFWTMFTRRKVETIADMLVKKATPDASEMPHFTITRKQARDIGRWIAWVQPLAHGKRVVEANCTRCHATKRGTKSNHPDAPPFNTLFKRYPIDALEEAFAEGIYTGHPDMPVFKLTNVQINDVLAYLERLQGK